jgi:hypothetical protein
VGLRAALAAFVAAVWVLGAPAASAGEDVHLGVASCKGSPCHGSAADLKKSLGILQSEYQTWQRYDKHAKAYLALLSERGERIADNLGLGKAETASQCLVCHADWVPAQRRGVEFRFEDGVGCEACHGGAERWLGPHVGGRIGHDDLVKAYGLNATERPLQRAELCLTCHVGDSAHPIDHQIMGAGHPRLAFELQTFSQIQPAHFRVDGVYRSRKTAFAGVQFWAVGQAVTLEKLATALADRKPPTAGVFAELALFDCGGCHHPVGTPHWRKGDNSGLGPGMPHFNDANALMLGVIAARVAPELATRLDRLLPALQRAVVLHEGNPDEIGRELAQSAHQLAELLSERSFSPEDLRAITLGLTQLAIGPELTGYGAAEQSTMALAALIDTLNQSGATDPRQYAAVKAALDRAYAATEKEEDYDPAKFAAAAQAVAHAMQVW